MIATVVILAVRRIYGDSEQDAALTAGDCKALEAVVTTGHSQRITYPGHTVWFSPEWHEPMCVVYELTRQHTRGPVERQGAFETDSAVAGCASPKDYTRSGYERGHMAPAADFKWSAKAMSATFKMTNVCPQTSLLNGGAWSRLEQKVREWAIRDSVLIVASGPIVGKRHRTVGKSQVAVPEAFFKVILAPCVPRPRAIAFIYPNGAATRSLSDYVVTVDSVEHATGLDFFSSLPDQVETAIESRSNLSHWTR